MIPYHQGTNSSRRGLNMASFVQRFALKKKEGGGNSIQQEVILEQMHQVQEDLAAQISQETRSVENIQAILTLGSKSISSHTKSVQETLLEQEIEENSVERLLKAIELATSPEELSALMQQYEELLAGWHNKVSLLRSEKHLKEYLAIVAALSMLQKMLQNPDLLLPAKQITETIQNSLKSQQQAIENQAKLMQAQNKRLHEQTQLLAKQLSQTELSFQAALEALKKNPGNLSREELTAALKQLQDALKQVQELKEKTLSGNQLDFKEVLDSLKKIHEQSEKLIESGKLSETALHAIRHSQQSLQQTIQQTTVIQQLHKNISALQTSHILQISQNASNIMQMHIAALVGEKAILQALSLEEKGQILPNQKQSSNPAQILELAARSQEANMLRDMEMKSSLSNQTRAMSEIARNTAIEQNQAAMRASEVLEMTKQTITGTWQRAQVTAQQHQTVQHLSEATKHSSVQVQQAEQPARNNAQPNNIIQITSAMQYQTVRQEPVSERQSQLSNAPREAQISEERKTSFVESYRRESSASKDLAESSSRVCKCANHVERAEQIRTNARIVGFGL